MIGRDPKRRPETQLLDDVSPDRSNLYRGVVAWADDVDGWRRSARETLDETPGRVLRRTVWDHPESPEQRLAVDVVECASGDDAIAALGDRLEWNELATLAVGPKGLGAAAFMHPKSAPPAVFFVRANLCISVVSFARRATPALPVAERIDQRLGAPPPSVDVSRLHLEREPAAHDATGVSLRLPFPLAEDGYLRYTADGGTIEIRDDHVVVIPSGPGAVVRVFVIEPGRAPVAGTLSI